MNYGIEVFNSSGKLQVSHERTNYMLVASGNVSLGAASVDSFGGVSPSSADILVSYSDDLVFVQGLGLSKGYKTSGKVVVKSFSQQAQTVKYRIYRNANNITLTSTGYGLEVYNDNGDMQFSSNYPPMNIIGVFDVVGGNPSGASGTVGAYALLENVGSYRYSPGEEQFPGELEYLVVNSSSTNYSAGNEYTSYYGNDSWESTLTRTLVFIKE